MVDIHFYRASVSSVFATLVVAAFAVPPPAPVSVFPYRSCTNSVNFTWGAELKYQRDLGTMWGSTEVTINIWAKKGCHKALEYLDIGLPDWEGRPYVTGACWRLKDC